MPYQLGTSAGTLQAATAWFGGFNPRARYAPAAELATAHSGELVEIGYPRAIWRLSAISISDYAALRFNLGIAYSGEVYIETRNEDDVYRTYRALLRLPNPATLDRHGGYYKDVELEFVLLEVV